MSMISRHPKRSKIARDLSPVGYGKPPRTHQFKPGQSGNPKGRPRDAKNEAAILRALLNRKIDVREGGRVRKITVLEAILLRFTEDALKGNTKTAAFLFNRYANVEPDEAHDSDLSAADRQVLDKLIRRLQTERGEKT